MPLQEFISHWFSVGNNVLRTWEQREHKAGAKAPDGELGFTLPAAPSASLSWYCCCCCCVGARIQWDGSNKEFLREFHQERSFCLTNTPGSERDTLFEGVSQPLLRPSPRGYGQVRFWKSGLGLTCQNLLVSWKEMETEQVGAHLAAAGAVAAVASPGSGSQHRSRVYGSAPAR